MAVDYVALVGYGLIIVGAVIAIMMIGMRAKARTVVVTFLPMALIGIVVGGFSISTPWLSNIFTGEQPSNLAGLPTSPGQAVSLTPATVETVPLIDVACPDTKTTNFFLDVVNYQNLTGEQFDVTYSMFRVEGGKIVQREARPTDTTTPAATAIKCGAEYVVDIEAAANDEGDNTFIYGILDPESAESGKKAFVQEIKNSKGQVTRWIDPENGNLRFIADGQNVAVVIGVTQHGILEMSGYSNLAPTGSLCNGDDVCGDFEADGTTWNSTANASLAIGQGGCYDISWTAETTRVDTVFGDRGYCVGLDSGTDIWKEPIKSAFDGNQVNDMKGSLSEKWKQRDGSRFEFVFCDEDEIQDARNPTEFRIKQCAVDTANPGATDDTNLTWMAYGQFQSGNAFTVKIDLVTDAGTPVPVYPYASLRLDVT